MDSSKVHFYWRSLQALEETGVLMRYGSQKPKKYQVRNFFKFFELFYDTYINNQKLM
jgi:hypothetical protein